MAEQSAHNCLFCRIASGLPVGPGKPVTELVYENDVVVAFKDIRPATDHHYLIVPKTHSGNPKSLSAERLSLVKEMRGYAQEVLTQQGVSSAKESSLYGYHWPPFNTIQHLHLHAIGNRASMSFMARMAYMNNSMWFVTHDWLVQRLENMKKE